ncbi:hypothetical protein GJ496_005052, partial [Pomphorhynchus laevis]
ITSDLGTFLSVEYGEGSFESKIQWKLRDNLYKRTIPCTTRLPRDGEVPGKDYIFLSEDEFKIADIKGKMLETGSYQGYMYGTPLPGFMGNTVEETNSIVHNMQIPINGECSGEFITVSLVKGKEGFGFTIIGGNNNDSSSSEFLEIRTIIPGGPAAETKQLKPSDVLVYINNTCILGYSHTKVFELFRLIKPGEKIELTVCRGHQPCKSRNISSYLLNHLTNKDIQYKESLGNNFEKRTVQIQKGPSGFGFTVVDCSGLEDLSDNFTESHMTGSVDMTKGGQRVKQIFDSLRCGQLKVGDRVSKVNGRSVINLSHTKLVDIFKACPSNEKCTMEVLRLKSATSDNYSNRLLHNHNKIRPGNEKLLPQNSDNSISKMNGHSVNIKSLKQRKGLSTTLFIPTANDGFGFRVVGGREDGSQVSIGYIVPDGIADLDGILLAGDKIVEIDGVDVSGASHQFAVDLILKSKERKKVTVNVERDSFVYDSDNVTIQKLSSQTNIINPAKTDKYPFTLTLTKANDESYGFVISSSVDQLYSVIGRILDNSPAYRSNALSAGDRILSVNGMCIDRMAHNEIVSLIRESGNKITLEIGAPSLSSNFTAPKFKIGSSHSNSNSFILSTDTSDGDPALAYNEHGTLNTKNANLINSTVSPSVYNSQQINDFRGYESDGYKAQCVVARPLQSSSTYRHSGSLKCQSYPDTSDFCQYDKLPFFCGQSMHVCFVNLQKTNEGYGFSIRGGKEYNMPLYIVNLAPNGPAENSGQLTSGDEILEINGVDARLMSHREAIYLIKGNRDSISLVVHKTGKQPPSIEDVNFAINKSQNNSIRRSRTPLV